MIYSFNRCAALAVVAALASVAWSVSATVRESNFAPPSASLPAGVQAAVDALDQAARSPGIEPGERVALQLLAPRDKQRQTSRSTTHIVGRTQPGNQAFVGGQEVPVASTGVFVRDHVPLSDGMNRIPIRVVSRDGVSREVVMEVERAEPPSPAVPPTPPAPPPSLEVWPEPRSYVVGSGGADLTWGLHQVRLGGPNLAELLPGTRLMVDGQRGEHLRVRLTPDFEAWTPARNLTALADAQPAAPFTLSNMTLTGGADADTLSIPWGARVPYAVRQQRGADGKPVIELEFFGGHLAATWLIHRNDPQVVEKVTVDQTLRERPFVRLHLRDKTLWGYEVVLAGGVLQVKVRAAPQLNSTRNQPLRGLKVALEAGHGSPVNLGAVGLTGAREKDVNLATTWLLQQELERMGASVYMVRAGDENPSPRERGMMAANSGAQLFISVHANSTETDNGFLRGKGASVFYKHDHGRLLGSAIYKRFLQATGLPDFGLVGNFNYTPIRVNTAMPSALVELAFMSHPYEEAQLLDPAVRLKMAKAIAVGVQDFVCQSLGQACSR